MSNLARLMKEVDAWKVGREDEGRHEGPGDNGNRDSLASTPSGSTRQEPSRAGIVDDGQSAPSQAKASPIRPEPSLSKDANPDPMRKTPHPPMTAFPVEGKPGFYVIDGELVGPDFVFSKGRRLKGRAYLMAKEYVLAESKRLRGAYVCEIGDHYLTELTAEVHHRVKRDYHVARALGIACHSHNAVHGDPHGVRVSVLRERATARRGICGRTGPSPPTSAASTGATRCIPGPCG